MSKPKIVCMTSMRNDSWILKNFLDCARTWADWVIIGDHNSTDDSASIARSYDCVKVIPHQPSSSFLERRRDLLGEARKIPDPRLLFFLDSDEMLSANWTYSPEWTRMLNAQPGARFSLNWLEILPGLKEAAVFWMDAVLVDDGTEYPLGERIHGSRLPGITNDAIKLNDIKLLHYNLIDPGRIFSKHRYFKCY